MKTRLFHCALCLACLISLVSFATPAIATPLLQEQESSAEVEDQAVEDTAATQTPAKVDVEPIARDDEIADRLNEILAATKWFVDAKADVEDGVVFLTGEAKDDEYKKWAGQLAGKTQDVAAVVNRMDVTQKSVWDFSSAFKNLRDFRDNAIQSLPLFVFSVLILIVTWALAKLATYVAAKLFRKRIPNNLLRWVATRTVSLPIMILGIYLVLRVAGLTQLALTVLGGTGLIGLVIGIAFQDIAENFLASVLISIQKPFRIGDFIKVDQHEGIVQRVTTRGTMLLTPDGNLVQIPNSNVYKSIIENFTANPLRRVSFDLGVGYDDSASDAQRMILEKVKEHSATLNDPAPRVLLDSLGASTVNMKTLFWIDGSKNDLLSVRSSCMRIAKQALLQQGISMPDEAREVIFPNGVPVQMHGDAEDPNQSHKDANREPVLSAKHQLQPQEEDQSEAEGHMESETDDLQRQAADSWLPGDGEEILVE
jgi:small-conductance mechanosensitive channel